MTGRFFDMQILLRTFSEYVVKTAEKFKPRFDSVFPENRAGRKNALELIEGH